MFDTATGTGRCAMSEQDEEDDRSYEARVVESAPDWVPIATLGLAGFSAAATGVNTGYSIYRDQRDERRREAEQHDETPRLILPDDVRDE